ncbi:ribonuclease P protein subunit p25-like protein isoform X1 [Clupea harengus]|uniref:Ribonuclease P protein subunit p25-like protein isoform X1 n=2 Tax=Clupea harengus TaxID=7950 RepID=A0A6P8FXZ0_CLUHA|nr:ribonuclease P protein subunit p25-like protein isoform X1 [Clupea harengus]
MSATLKTFPCRQERGITDMENYSKARTVEQPCSCPFTGLPSETPEVRVKDGSKIRNLMRFALSRMEDKPASAEGDGDGEEAEPKRSVEKVCRQIMFTGVGPSVSKAITCVEILKRRVRGLHQYTRLHHQTVQEVWEPLEPEAGLDSLTVNRNVPAVWVLLSKDPLDTNQPGYQAPGSFDALWAQAAKEEMASQRHGQRKKRGGGGGGGGGGVGRGKAPGKAPGRQAGRPREPRKSQGRGGGGGPE